jgi:hypothetical protein
MVVMCCKHRWNGDIQGIGISVKLRRAAEHREP